MRSINQKGQFSPIGNSNVKPASVDSVLKLLEEELPKLRKDITITATTNENKINEELCLILGRGSRRKEYPFIFIHETNEGKRRVDLGVFDSMKEEEIQTHVTATGTAIYKQGKKSLCVIEGKRLPTLGSGREKEYVTGIDKNKATGGMERFKKGKHGKHLVQAIIVAYVQEDSLNLWIKRINNWIEDLALNNTDSEIIWTISDKLKRRITQNTDLAKLVSKNKRLVSTIEDEITIHHFLVMVV